MVVATNTYKRLTPRFLEAQNDHLVDNDTHGEPWSNMAHPRHIKDYLETNGYPEM
jgi:hypothetical protein